jgi:hypothetical protein
MVSTAGYISKVLRRLNTWVYMLGSAAITVKTNLHSSSPPVAFEKSRASLRFLDRMVEAPNVTCLSSKKMTHELLNFVNLKEGFEKAYKRDIV